MEPQWIAAAYGGVLAAMSVVTLVVYAWDKRRAQRGGWRVSERTLHLLELLGGWPGAWAAQRLLRHKSRKGSYRLVFALIVLLHMAAIAGFVWWWVKPA